MIFIGLGKVIDLENTISSSQSLNFQQTHLFYFNTSVLQNHLLIQSVYRSSFTAHLLVKNSLAAAINGNKAIQTPCKEKWVPFLSAVKTLYHE